MQIKLEGEWDGKSHLGAWIGSGLKGARVLSSNFWGEYQ